MKSSLDLITTQEMVSLENTLTRLIWYLSSERHFGAILVKPSVNPITTQKKANFQDTVRRL